MKKSALSFFNNEWVVFVPNEDEHHDEEEGEHHEEESVHMDEHGDEGTEDHEEHDGEEEHGGHNEEEAPYTLEVVKIITQDEDYVAIKGLHEGEEYVSDKAYYVKSMILKGSLGGHGH